MKCALIILAMVVSTVLMLGAVPGSSAREGIGPAPSAVTKLAFNRRAIPRPFMRPPFGRPFPVHRPIYRRPAVTVVAPVITVAPPPPPVVVTPPPPAPVRHVTLPLAEPLVVEQSGPGRYETRTRVAPSGERYEEQVWVSAP